ncbi:MAG TPA: hypothetical protein VMP67_05350 [Candidatus Limnocylindria bacterium]|nr:hypothetical protein [Candidatus Limnocylindria bacterium]
MFGAAPGDTQASDRACRGVLRGITVDNLRVPAGAYSQLRGTYSVGRIANEAEPSDLCVTGDDR